MSDLTGWSVADVRCRRLHERYIGGMLAACIVGLVAVKWADVPKLFEYLSFALTLASLLLALIAIVYAMYSNNSMQSSMSAVTAGADLMKGTANSVATSSQTVVKSVETVASLVERIDVTVLAMQSRVEETHSRVTELSARSMAPPASVEPAEKPESDADSFLTHSSWFGALIFYAAMYCERHRKSLDIETLSAAFGGSSQRMGGYFLGYFVASSAAGFFESEAADGGYWITDPQKGASLELAEQKLAAKVDNEEQKNMKDSKRRDVEALKKWVESSMEPSQPKEEKK